MSNLSIYLSQNNAAPAAGARVCAGSLLALATTTSIHQYCSKRIPDKNWVHHNQGLTVLQQERQQGALL
jgi:hypothetical protein